MAFGVNQDVLGLDVAVDDAVFMHVLKRGQDAHRDLHRGFRSQRSLFFDDLLEGPPFDVFQNNIPVLVLRPHVQKVDDIMVADLAGGEGLPAEALEEIFIMVVFRLQDLDGHIVMRPLVQGFINQRHAALADKFYQLIAVVQ